MFHDIIEFLYIYCTWQLRVGLKGEAEVQHIE